MKLRPKTTWPIIKELLEDVRVPYIQHKLVGEVYPKPHFIFNAFKLTDFENLKVVILGQDPYFNIEDDVPQAMGLAFSIPVGITIPSSLDNIFKNLIKYKHIIKKPKHGNLENWAKQGCLLLNTSLTVQNKKANSHSSMWKWFTDGIIKFISKEKEHIVFVLWGSNAYEKINIIDQDKHEVIISSHPSGLSASKPMKNFSAFNDFDHFGKINEFLKEWKMKEIKW